MFSNTSLPCLSCCACTLELQVLHTRISKPRRLLQYTRQHTHTLGDGAGEEWVNQGMRGRGTYAWEALNHSACFMHSVAAQRSHNLHPRRQPTRARTCKTPVRCAAAYRAARGMSRRTMLTHAAARAASSQAACWAGSACDGRRLRFACSYIDNMGMDCMCVNYMDMHIHAR